MTPEQFSQLLDVLNKITLTGFLAIALVYQVRENRRILDILLTQLDKRAARAEIIAFHTRNSSPQELPNGGDASLFSKS